MKYALQVEHVTKIYDGFTLDDVSLCIPGGTIMGLIGENGAGKSTLLKAILGAVNLNAGSISVLGTTPEQAKADMGVVFDEGLFHDLLKADQVGKLMAGLYSTWDEALFQQYLTEFELPKDKKIKEYSRGMKMKLSIASALAHRPKLLILDEATGGLDPVVRDHILDILLDFVADEDHAVLLSSHITSDLEKACDMVTYLHKGRVTLAGEKDELLERHGRLTCTKEQLTAIDPTLLLGSRISRFSAEAVLRDRVTFRKAWPDLPLDPASLEDLMVFSAQEEQQ